MKKRIQSYMAYMDQQLENNDSGLSYEELCIQHEKQLAYFMHERLVHLLVTLTFAILAFVTFFMAVMNFSMGKGKKGLTNGSESVTMPTNQGGYADKHRRKEKISDEMLRRDEGLRLKVYWDTEGYPTIGIGHLIMKQPVRDMTQINKVLSKQVGREITGNPGSITMEEAVTLFERDLADMQRDIKSHSKVGPVWQAVNRSR